MALTQMGRMFREMDVMEFYLERIAAILYGTVMCAMLDLYWPGMARKTLETATGTSTATAEERLSLFF